MTPAEVLTEIQKLPLSDVRQVVDGLTTFLHEREQPIEVDDDLERREDEFERYLLAEGIISSIPSRDETQDEDDFEPIEFEGEPLSELIIRERR